MDDLQKKEIRERREEGIIHVSVGLEDPDDIIQDLDQALNDEAIMAKEALMAYVLLKKYVS